jgi:hypothetical protein
MAQTLPQSRESVNYYQALTLGADQLQGAIDITGYVFEMDLARSNVATVLIGLNMAVTELGEGFAIVSGANRMLTIRILSGTLSDLPDTTGDFELFGDLLATPPGGERFFVQDMILPVTKGPTV